MVNERYARAYVEVLQCLKLLSKEEYEKIPRKLINYFEKNKDLNYNYKFDKDKNIFQQKISKEANAINLYLYMKYFSTKNINNKINKRLEKNEKEYRLLLEEKYNSKALFKNNKEGELEIQKTKKENLTIIIYKESILEKIKNWIKRIIQK